MPEVSSWKPVSCLFFLFFFLFFFRSVPYFTRRRLVNVRFLSPPFGTQWIPSPCYSSLWLSLSICAWLWSIPVSLFACALPLALTLYHISSTPKAPLNCENLRFLSLARMQSDADVLLAALLDTKWLLLKTFLHVKVWPFQNWLKMLLRELFSAHTFSSSIQPIRTLFQNFHIFSLECSAYLAMFVSSSVFFISIFFFCLSCF